MMDTDTTGKFDLIHDKITRTIEKSNNLLHKKAIALVKGLKDQLGNRSTGVEGIKNYVKNVLDLIDVIFNKISNTRADASSLEEDLKNAEALLFTLAVCIKQLPFGLLRNETICERIMMNVDRYLKLAGLITIKNEIKKYCIIIAEKLFLSRNETELKDENDFVVGFFSELFFTLLEAANVKSNGELQKCLIKSLCKIFKTPNMTNIVKMTLLLQIKIYLVRKIRGLNIGKDFEGNTMKLIGDINSRIKQISTSEGEMMLKFLCPILQFLPFDIVNDLILELTDMIVESENKHILLNSLLCFEVAFNTKSFALETNEKIINLLLSKDFLINSNDTTNFDVDNQKEPFGDTKRFDINTSLTIAFMKSTTAVLMNLGRLNIFIGMKHFTSVMSLLGEFLTSYDDFLKNSIFNCLQNLLNQMMSKKNMNILFSSQIKKREDVNNNEINIDPNELTFEVNLTAKKESDSNILNHIEQLSVNLLYLTSDRFDDVKPGFNLLHNFLEKITTFSNNSTEERNFLISHIHPLIETILNKLSESEKLQKTQTFKVFLGKIFNFVSSSLILRSFPLQILDFDICHDDYTEDSKVWIVSYIEKFLRNENAQTLREFYESFTVTIEEIEKVLLRLKNTKSRQKQNEQMIIENDDRTVNNMMTDAPEEEEELDENFIINKNESHHIRTIKIKRYELILQQIWGLMPKFNQWNENFDLYVKEILKKLEFVINNYNKEIDTSIFVPNIKEVIFRVLTKFISTSFKFNDMKSLEVVKKEGKIFFSKCLSQIVNQKLSNSELKEGFNLISSFCKIMSDKFLYKIVCEMIERFDTSFQINIQVNDNISSSSNKAKLNESLNFTLNEEMNVETNTVSKNVSKKDRNTLSANKKKETNLLCLRIEIINYILKNVNSFKSHENNSQTNIFILLNSFFEKFFFNEKMKSGANQIIKKKLIDLFIILLGKVEKSDGVIEIFSKFANEYKGLDNLSAKQKTKIFEFIVDTLVNKFNATTKLEGGNLDVSECFSQLHILIEVVTLTKDMNRKVRNSAYEMIGKISDFMCESNLFNEWIKMILAILASNSSFLKSASINALARIFWQKRNQSDDYTVRLLNETAQVILLLLKDNNKELTKSIFLFIRVLLYLNIGSGSQEMTKKIVVSIFHDLSEDVRKEFKVKIRNLLKNLIIKFSYEEVKNMIPKDVETLLAYINKYIVRKAKTMTKEEESVYGAGVSLDHSVMMDNDENLLDEEEEYIQKEFKKMEKRKGDEEKFFERLDKLNIEEDDPELIKKKNDSEVPKNEKLDRIEQLFNKDNIELENFFYVNPYASSNTLSTKDKKEQPEKDKDVFFDKKKGKIFVKDIPITTKDSKVKDKTLIGLTNKNDDLFDFPKPQPGSKLLNKKRVQNVRNDRDDLDDNEMDLMSKVKVSKRKISHSKEKVQHGKRNRETHVVKFSGDEYKNKAGKGDKLIQGKYEPFAYIQLNPKSTSHKNRSNTLELFKGIMHPEKNK